MDSDNPPAWGGGLKSEVEITLRLNNNACHFEASELIITTETNNIRAAGLIKVFSLEFTFSPSSTRRQMSIFFICGKS